jgi:hypothetical protein
MKTTVMWLVLICLTLLSLLFNNINSTRLIVMGLFSVKFILVAFYFMGIKEAHTFWKVFSVLLILFISGIIIFI